MIQQIKTNSSVKNYMIPFEGHFEKAKCKQTENRQKAPRVSGNS